jgi:hypothetical protein
MAHRAQRRVSTPTKPGGCVTMRLPVLFAQGHLEIPILNLNGEIDLWCPGYQNVPKFRDVFQVARNSDATVITYPGLSHSLQKTRTGLSRTCDEVIDPKVLDEISAWTSKHVETKP